MAAAKAATKKTANTAKKAVSKTAKRITQADIEANFDRIQKTLDEIGAAHRETEETLSKAIASTEKTLNKAIGGLSNTLGSLVEQEKIERILRAGFEAPSAHNHRPWEFLVITGKDDLKAIAEMAPYAKMTAEAAAAIIPCVNLHLAGNVDLENPWWIQDLSAATENILLQIVDEGLGGVWLGWYPEKERARIFSARFGLPAHVLPFSVVALGYPARIPGKRDRFDPEKVHYGAWGKR
jgi:nitroreductase